MYIQTNNLTAADRQTDIVTAQKDKINILHNYLPDFPRILLYQNAKYKLLYQISK